MANITFKGSTVSTVGDMIPVGSQAPDFVLVSQELEQITLEDLQKKFPGKRKILNITPSFDTSVCALSAKTFDTFTIKDTIVIGISRDTPFAQSRFCEANKMINSQSLADLHHVFGENYGLALADGPLQGLLARAVIVLDENNIVIHSQLVPEITNEPDYDSVAKSLE